MTQEHENTFRVRGRDPSRVRVVIQGPQGSGKTLLADAIVMLLEDMDNEAAAKFVDVNGDRPVPIFSEQGDGPPVQYTQNRRSPRG